MTSRPANLTLFCSAVATLLLCRAPALAALPGPTQRLGACMSQMARPDELFPHTGGLRIVVVRFVGQDEPSEKMGADLAYSLSQELPTYIRTSLKGDAQAAGLAEEDMQIAYIPCLLSSHAQAREVGQAWGADLVFWGQASCSRSDPQNYKLAPVVEKGAQVTVRVEGHVEAKRGDVQIGVVDNRKVVVPPASGQFKTSVTLVHWRGLQGRSDQAVRIDPAVVLDLDFPRLASERPLSLFRWAVGVYAFYGQRYALAAARFEESAAELYASADERSQLYRVMGISYLYAGHPERGVAALEQARASCGSSDAHCRAMALNNLGWAVDRLGKKPEALSYFEQALPLVKQVGDRAGQARTLNNIGVVYDALGDKPKALSYYEQALALQKQVGDRSGQATTLNNIGAVYSTLGDKPRALSYYEQALALMKQVGDRTCEARTLNNIGAVYDDLGDKPKALSYYEQALPIQKQLGDRAGEARTLNNIGLLHSDLGNKPKALKYYEQALLLQKQVGDRVGEATTLNNIGFVYDALWDKPKALSYYEQALPIQKQLGDRAGEARTLNNIGCVYSALGNRPSALSSFEQALPLVKQVGDRAGQARTLNNIGSVYDALGDKPRALSYYEQALALQKQVGDRSGQATTLSNIGFVYDALGDKPKALSYYEQALPIQKQLGDRAGEARTLNNIGFVYDALGDKLRALSCYEQALSLQKQVGDRVGEGNTLDNLASVLANLGRIRPAIQRHREASACYLARRPPDVQEAVVSLGLALGVALRSRLWPEASRVLSEIEALKPAPVALARWRARLAGHSAAPDATARYQELARLAAALPPEAQASTRMQAQAGELRAQKTPLFVDCAGLVITEVVAGSQATRLGLLPGDIVLRYQNQCVDEPSKLIDLVKTTQPSAAASLVLVRPDGARTLSLQGGRIGIATEEF